MMFKVEIDLSNAAFADDPQETARILRELARFLSIDVTDPEHREIKLRDVNGNIVGYADIMRGRVRTRD